MMITIDYYISVYLKYFIHKFYNLFFYFSAEFVDKICDVYLMVYYYCWLWRFAPNEVKGDIFYMLFELGLKKYLIGNSSTLFVDETSRIRTRQFVSKLFCYECNHQFE